MKCAYTEVVFPKLKTNTEGEHGEQRIWNELMYGDYVGVGLRR